MLFAHSHNVNMSSRPRTRPLEVLEDLRRTSGWYLAAWREYRGLSQDDLALEMGISKGKVSELENGKPRKDGSLPRFNRDSLEAAARALNVNRGELLDINPYTANPAWLQILDKFRRLDADSQATAVRLISQLEPEKKAGNGS